jgi:hypothetical protein
LLIAAGGTVLAVRTSDDDATSEELDVRSCATGPLSSGGEVLEWDLGCLDELTGLRCFEKYDPPEELSVCTEQIYAAAGIDFEPIESPCRYDENGWPLPGSPQGCSPVAKCATCTVAPPGSPTPTPILRRNEGAILTEPAVHKAGDAASLGRTDCPAGWQAVVSETSGMSICFPPEGRLTRGGPGDTDVIEEDTFEITVPSAQAGIVLVVTVVRSTGLTGPYGERCVDPDLSPRNGLPARTCRWPEGHRQGNYEGITQVFALTQVVESAGFQWVFEGAVWVPNNESPGNVDSLEAMANDLVATWRLP